jgi:general secretion pathway protein N
MNDRWTHGLAWLAALLGLTLALSLFAPARWLGTALAWGTHDQVRLVNTRGSVWQGQGDLLLTGGQGSRTESALPQGLRWRIRPSWAEGRPALSVRLETPCCSTRPVQLHGIPGWKGFALKVAAFESQWPAVLLTGLGTPWNTLRPEGQLVLQSGGLSIQRLAGRWALQGSLRIDALDLTSRLSTLRPLGSYRVNLEATADGSSAQLQLSTLRGGLQLQGQGQWIAGRLRFQGEAQAAPGRERALENLLNIIGRRQGPRSILKVG